MEQLLDETRCSIWRTVGRTEKVPSPRPSIGCGEFVAHCYQGLEDEPTFM